MDDFDIIELNDVTFDDYKEWFEKYKNNNDLNEKKFQNEVVKKFICAICVGLDVEDSAIKGPKSIRHDYLQYCGTYIDKNGIEQASTPDLVIAKNWNWLNKENEVDYRAVIEVKSPYLKPIYHNDYKNYADALKNELKRHLSAKKNDKVILTDTLKWEFYKKCDKLEPIQTYKLYDYDLIGKKWEWKKGEKRILKDDVTKELFGNSLEYELQIKEFEELKEFLRKFLNKED